MESKIDIFFIIGRIALMKQKLSILFLTLFVASFCGCAAKKPLLDEVFEQANKAYDKQAYDAAAIKYQEFIRTAPDTPLSQAAKYFLADCYKQLGEFDKALAAYTELISQEQESFWVEQALHDKTELEEVLADFRGQ